MFSLDDVSRETISRIEEYEALLSKWSPSINLVAKSTLSEVRERHVLDSAALFPLLNSDHSSLVDIGSGAGLPGIVLAIIAKEKAPNVRVSLIESDQRKAAFLRTVSIQLKLDAKIVAERIEEAISSNADVVTARALAPLPKLLGYVHRHVKAGGVALLQKGKTHADEVALATEFWNFDVEVISSTGDAESVVLKIENLKEKRQNES